MSGSGPKLQSKKPHWPHVSHFTVLRPEVEAEVNVADRCRRLCRQLTQIRWTIYWGRTKQSHQAQSISCWKAVSVIATERSVPRFAYKPVSVLLFYIWVQTPSVIVSINFSKMELKIKDNKFVSVKQTNNLLWSPPPRITKSCQHRHHFWLHDWLPSADTLAFAPVWFLKECDRRISCLSAVEASQTKLWQL